MRSKTNKVGLTKIELTTIISLVVTFVIVAAYFFYLHTKYSRGDYLVSCAYITPEGFMPTVKFPAKNMEITSFGVIKHSNGMYVPGTNEVCVTEVQKEVGK